MSASQNRPSGWLKKQPAVPSRRPRIRVPAPPPGQSFSELLATPARRAEIAKTKVKRWSK